MRKRFATFSAGVLLAAIAAAVVAPGVHGAPTRWPGPVAQPTSPDTGRPVAGSNAASRQAASAASVDARAIDAIFSKWTPSTPGCAVGASAGGTPVVATAYGMADLEHDVPNTPDTIFEAGSVSKQFTAAAVLLLARDGKLSLDDPVRKYIPELPAYDLNGEAIDPSTDGDRTAAAPLTIRMMLNHTSGLRDWGSVEAIAGWPRTTRVYTHAHVLDIISRQRALNFPPGTRWSYSNTGFNLAAIIVSRVSGMPFAEFSRARIFAPLAMAHTSWRDDHTRIVKGRAVAYDEQKDGWHIDMPFENIHGNAGLLTTVGDLLKWNENFGAPVVGDAAFVAEQQKPGQFNDGRVHDYALGLMVGTRKGVREVSHSGSTAGYRAFLTRFPDQRVSVAILCNAASANATDYAHRVADLLLDGALKAEPRATPRAPDELASVAGLYRNVRTGLPLTMTRDKDGVRAGDVWVADRPGHLRVTDPFGSVDEYERVEPAAPTPRQLEELAGRYSSADAETTLTAVVENGGLVLKRRPDTTITLTPVYRDAFRSRQFGLVIFRRDSAGRVVALSVVDPRVWDLRFVRES